VPSRAWPTWTHLYDYLQQDPKTENLAGVLHSWVHGSLSGIFDGHTNVNLDNQYVVLDIHDVTRHSLALAPVQFACMAYLWDEINRDWRERKVLDLDELGIFADHQDALAFAWMVVKCARRRRCRVQIATQDPADFLAGGTKYAQGILTNCATKVLGYLEPTALAQIAGALRLSEAEQDLILRLQVWEKLIVCGEQQAHVEVVASLPELRILDPEGYERATGRPA
jgi:type IV secretory pathway VirB4 component